MEKDTFVNFRPLSGNLIFQSFFKPVITSANKFPSPIGESYFSIIKLRTTKRANRFPSPIGESYFSMQFRFTAYPWSRCISVPYRGILFFNETFTVVKKLKKQFPSPIGESYFSMRIIERRNQDDK